VCISPTTSSQQSTATSRTARQTGCWGWWSGQLSTETEIWWCGCTSLVRPHLKYCSPVWSPHYRKDEILLERVQHRFARFFDDLKDLDYNERLWKLKLWSLQERRNRADLIELFKMVRGISTVPLDSYFQLADGRRTRGHSWKLMKSHSRCDAQLHFFSARVVNRWNSFCTRWDATGLHVLRNRFSTLHILYLYHNTEK